MKSKTASVDEIRATRLITAIKTPTPSAIDESIFAGTKKHTVTIRQTFKRIGVAAAAAKVHHGFAPPVPWAWAFETRRITK